MSSRSHHTKLAPPDRWDTEVLPRLPSDLELHAQRLAALSRHRQFAHAHLLLRGLLAYALQATSLAQLAAWGVLADVADLSASAWLKRLRAAAPWLSWLLAQLLAGVPAPWLVDRGRVRVKLIDGTTVGRVGGRGDEWRVQLSYDLVAGRFTELVLLDPSQGEALGLMQLAPGDIAVVDSGFGRRLHLAAGVAQGADVVMRVYLPTCPLHDRAGRPLDLVRQLERRQRTPLDLAAAVQHEGQLLNVRVVAVALPGDQAQAARRRLRRTCQRKGRIPSATGLLLATWLVVVTTLRADRWSLDEVVQLYRARWQIEVAFKRLKQLLGLHRLRCTSATSAIPLLTLYLVAWALSSELVSDLRPALQRAAAPAPATLPGQWPEADAVVSTWTLCQLSLAVLRQQVQGQWSEGRVKACLTLLCRHLVRHPRQRGRVHQETQVRARLTGQRLTQPRPHSSAL